MFCVFNLNTHFLLFTLFQLSLFITNTKLSKYKIIKLLLWIRNYQIIIFINLPGFNLTMVKSWWQSSAEHFTGAKLATSVAFGTWIVFYKVIDSVSAYAYLHIELYKNESE